MAIPLLLHVANASQALPIVAVAALRDRQLPVPYRRIAMWCCLLVVSDVADLLVSRNGASNLWTGYFILPLEVGMTLWIASAWQTTEARRRAYVLGIAVMGSVVGVALLLTDPSRTFELWIAPALALLAVAALLQTLVSRSLLSRKALERLDWFWICIGLGVFWTVQISAPAFASAFITTHVEWVETVWLLRSALMILGFVLISWGILCHRQQTYR